MRDWKRALWVSGMPGAVKVRAGGMARVIL